MPPTTNGRQNHSRVRLKRYMCISVRMQKIAVVTAETGTEGQYFQPLLLGPG